jgi:quercetin dioxygenase-like cupin family protein
MTYTPSPRPTYAGPTHIPYNTVTRYTWGDPIAGEVADWIYVSSNNIHQLVFGLPAGQMFRHSEAHRTIFAADELYYVLSGVLVASNPETGEVHQALPGEAIFFRRDTWHHAMSAGTEPLRVLEYFAPPPAQGTSGSYARTRDFLANPCYTQDRWLTRWPMEQLQIRAEQSMRVIRAADVLWRLEGQQQLIPVALLCSTEQLTVGRVSLLPGQQTSVQAHAGDECLYVLEGTLHMQLPESKRWHELGPGDGFYVPQGVNHQYANGGTLPASFVFGVAPAYLAQAT